MSEQKPDGDKVPFFDKKHRIKILKGNGEKKKHKGTGYFLLVSNVESNEPDKDFPIDVSAAVTYNVEAPAILRGMLNFFHQRDPKTTKMVVAGFIQFASEQERKKGPGIIVPGRN